MNTIGVVPSWCANVTTSLALSSVLQVFDPQLLQDNTPVGDLLLIGSVVVVADVSCFVHFF